MALINFRYWLFLITDFCYILPVIFAFLAKQRLSKAQKWFTWYLFSYFIVNIISDVLVSFFHQSNSYFGYFWSFIDCFFLYLFYLKISQYQEHKKVVSIIFAFSFFSFITDLLWITGFTNNENYFSEVIISICIFIISIYYLKIHLTNSKKTQVFNEIDLLIALSLMIKYFLKAIYGFLNSYLYETQSNYYLSAQTDNFYNFSTIITILIATWVFFSLKSQQHQNE